MARKVNEKSCSDSRLGLRFLMDWSPAADVWSLSRPLTDACVGGKCHWEERIGFRKQSSSAYDSKAPPVVIIAFCLVSIRAAAPSKAEIKKSMWTKSTLWIRFKQNRNITLENYNLSWSSAHILFNIFAHSSITACLLLMVHSIRAIELHPPESYVSIVQ